MHRHILLLLSGSLLGAAPAASAKTLRWDADRDIGSLDPDSFGDTFTLAWTVRPEVAHVVQLPDKAQHWLTRMGGTLT